MNRQEAEILETGTFLEGCGDGYDEILKKISDGYLVLHYSCHHNVYNVEFISFEDIVEFNYSICEDVEEYIFDGSYIEHEDGFGFCKPKNKEQ